MWKRISQYLRAALLGALIGLQVLLPMKAYAFTASLPSLMQQMTRLAIPVGRVGVGAVCGSMALPVCAAVGVVVTGLAFCASDETWCGVKTAKFGLGPFDPNPNPNNPPGTADQSVSGYTLSGSSVPGPYTSIDAAVAAQKASNSGLGDGGACSYDSSNKRVVCHSDKYGRDYYYPVGFNYVSSCPSGYGNLNTSTHLCSLVDASKVPNLTPYDCQIMVATATGNWNTDPANTGCPALPSSQISPDGKKKITINGPQLTIQTADGRRLDLVGQPGGTIHVTDYTPGTIGGLPSTMSWDATLNPQAGGGTVNNPKANTSMGNPAAQPNLQDQTLPPIAVASATATAGSTAPGVDCSDLAGCQWAKDSTLQGIASAVANTDAPRQPGVTDFDATVGAFKNHLPTPGDYRGPIDSFLKGLGFPNNGGQCSLTRTVTLFGHTMTLDFVPEGICGPYQEVANWVTWGAVAWIGWRQIRGLSGEVPGSESS